MIDNGFCSILVMLIIVNFSRRICRNKIVLADNEGKCNLEFTTLLARFTFVAVSNDFSRFQIGFMARLRFSDDRSVLRMMQPNDARL